MIINNVMSRGKLCGMNNVVVVNVRDGGNHRRRFALAATGARQIGDGDVARMSSDLKKNLDWSAKVFFL